jgi:hypothetical protein
MISFFLELTQTYSKLAKRDLEGMHPMLACICGLTNKGACHGS